MRGASSAGKKGCELLNSLPFYARELEDALGHERKETPMVERWEIRRVPSDAFADHSSQLTRRNGTDCCNVTRKLGPNFAHISPSGNEYRNPRGLDGASAELYRGGPEEPAGGSAGVRAAVLHASQGGREPRRRVRQWAQFSCASGEIRQLHRGGHADRLRERRGRGRWWRRIRR